MEHDPRRRVVRRDGPTLPRSLVWGAWLLVVIPLLGLFYLFFVKGHC